MAIGVVAAVVVLLAAGAAVALSRASKPRDLGVSCTQTDFDSACKKMGVEFPKTPPAGDGKRYERVYEGSKPLDATLTEAELSALMSFNHDASYWPIKIVWGAYPAWISSASRRPAMASTSLARSGRRPRGERRREPFCAPALCRMMRRCACDARWAAERIARCVSRGDALGVRLGALSDDDTDAGPVVR